MSFSSLHPALTLAIVSCDSWLGAFLQHCITATHETWTHWRRMCSEVALWSAKGKKWDDLGWRSGTIRRLGQASRSLSDVRSVCCGEGHRRVAKHRLIPPKLWFGFPLCHLGWILLGQRSQRSVGGERGMIWEEWKQQPQKGGGPIVYLFPLFFYHGAIVYAKILIFRQGIRVEWKLNIWPKPRVSNFSLGDGGGGTGGGIGEWVSKKWSNEGRQKGGTKCCETARHWSGFIISSVFNMQPLSLLCQLALPGQISLCLHFFKKQVWEKDQVVVAYFLFFFLLFLNQSC